MKKILIISISFVILFVSGFVWLSRDYKARDWIKYNLFYRDYLSWKETGGDFKPEYYVPFKLDRNKDSIVQDLSYDQVCSKMPFLTPGESYPIDSYKGEFLLRIRNEDPTIKILWFNKDDGFDYCVVITKSKNEIWLIKG